MYWLDTIIAKLGVQLPAVLGQSTMAQSLSTVPASDYYAGNGLSITATLTVTNGAYTAQDVVGGAISIPNAVRANGKEAVLNSVVLAGMTSAIGFEWWVLNSDLATPVADNGAFAMVAADYPKVVGVVSLGAGEQYQAGAGGVYVGSYGAIGKQMKAATGTRTLTAYLKHTTTTNPGTTTLYLTCGYEYIS